MYESLHYELQLPAAKIARARTVAGTTVLVRYAISDWFSAEEFTDIRVIQTIITSKLRKKKERKR